MTTSSSYCICEMDLKCLPWWLFSVYQCGILEDYSWYLHDILGNKVNKYRLSAKISESVTSGVTLAHTKISSYELFIKSSPQWTVCYRKYHICLTHLTYKTSTKKCRDRCRIQVDCNQGRHNVKINFN